LAAGRLASDSSGRTSQSGPDWARGIPKGSKGAPMLPVIYKFLLDADFSKAVLYLVAAGLVV
jgi:hypothetical protein